MSEPSVNRNDKEQAGIATFKCRFEKTKNFQSVFAIGAWGRISGHGEIILSLFNEVPEMPRSATYCQNADGTWVGAVPALEFQEKEETILREVHVDVVMSLDSAKRIRDNLAHFINMREQQEVNKSPALEAMKSIKGQ